MKSFFFIAGLLLQLSLSTHAHAVPMESAQYLNDAQAVEQYAAWAEEDESAFSRQRAFKDIDFSAIPEWRDYAQVVKAFELVRDTRFYSDDEVADFGRRITWLFTADGCFQRAGHVALELEKAGFPKVSQFFAFTDITVKWTYHVASVARVGNEVYVLDPAVFDRAPLTVWQWLERFANPSQETGVSLCDGNAWTPRSYCHSSETHPNYGPGQLIYYRQFFQAIERKFLGDRANDYLGEHPPWLQ